MNPTQKTIVFIAIILIFCCGVYTPYIGTETFIRTTYGRQSINTSWSHEDSNKGDGTVTIPVVVSSETVNSFMGYFPIFNPPSKIELLKSFYRTTDLGDNYKYESNIDLSRLVIQFFVILILTIGLVVLFTDSKQKGNPKTIK